MSRLVEYADELVTSVGPRPGASKGEHQAAELIAQNFDEIGLDTYIQEFTCARSTGWVRILYYVLSAIAAFVLFFVAGLKPLALILALVGAILLVLDLLGKNPLFNLFNKGLSQNVVARYSPEGADSRRKIIVVAHYDSGRSMIQCAPVMASSYVFLRKLIRIAVVGLFVLIVLSLVPFPDIVLLIIGILSLVLGIIVLVAALFEVINLFMPFNQGANCNASGIAALYGVAQTIAGSRASKAQNHAQANQERHLGSSSVSSMDNGDGYASDDYPDASTSRKRGIGGAATAAGSIFSKAKGLVSRSNSDGTAAGLNSGDALPEADYPVTGRSNRSSSANEAGAEPANALKRGGAGAVRVRSTGQIVSTGASVTSDFNGNSTADLTPETAAVNGSAFDTRTAPHEAGTRLTASIGSNLANAKDDSLSNGVVRSTVNPSIRTRPPLAVQEEQQRKLREEAEENRKQAGRTADGMPEWYANAKKKAAQKEASGRSKSIDERELVRSQFADVPLSGKDITAKSAAKTSSAPRRGDGIVPKIEKSIFAEPKIQDIKSDNAQEAKNNQAQVRDQTIETRTTAVPDVPNEATPDFAAIENASNSERNTEQAPRQAAQLTQQISQKDFSPQPEVLDVERSAELERSERANPQTDDPSSSASQSQGSRRSAAELLQQRLNGSAPEPIARRTNLPDPSVGQANEAQDLQAQAKQRQQEQQEKQEQQEQQEQTQIKQPESSAVQTTGAQPSSQSNSQPSSLQMDFSGLDRLANDANPDTDKQSSKQSDNKKRIPSLPNVASPLEQATVSPAPAAPTNDRLRNLPKLSLGDSGMIPTQQAAFDQQVLPEDQMLQPRDSRVSSTGSFAPLGATGMMKPVGEELLNYNQEGADIYIEDSDDSENAWAQSPEQSQNSTPAPSMVKIPQSRTKSFFGGLGDKLSGGSKKRVEDLDSSPSSWLGVDEDFNARNAGSEIGSWDNFSEEDDDGWKGGAYGGESDEENQEVLQSFSYELIDKEVWLVALGSHENKNAGLKNFLTEHERDLRNALIINIDGVGAGDLCFTVAEGTFRTLNTDHRLQNLAESASRATGVDLEPVSFVGYTTDASAALKEGMRAISILGLDRALPTGWRWSDDRLDIIDEDNLQAVTDVVVDMIKSS